MKTEELTNIGLTEEQVQQVFALNGKDVNALKEQVSDLTNQLNTANEILKGFEGVDPEVLNAEIQKLNTQLQETDAAWKAKMADRDFNDALSGAITNTGGRNAKAIAALMDLEALKASNGSFD